MIFIRLSTKIYGGNSLTTSIENDSYSKSCGYVEAGRLVFRRSMSGDEDTQDPFSYNGSQPGLFRNEKDSKHTSGSEQTGEI